jgi:hypothetical protein
MHFDITHLPQNPISTATSDPDPQLPLRGQSEEGGY